MLSLVAALSSLPLGRSVATALARRALALLMSDQIWLWFWVKWSSIFCSCCCWAAVSLKSCCSRVSTAWRTLPWLAAAGVVRSPPMAPSLAPANPAAAAITSVRIRLRQDAPFIGR